MKSPEVSIRFAFCSSVNLCGINREQIFRLPKSSRTMVYAVSLLTSNSSAINLGVSRRLVPAFLAHSRSFLGFCLSMADSNVAHPQSFPSLRESVWTIRKHLFCSRLPSHTPAPTFHASPLQFSLICSRNLLYICMLHCAVTLSLTMTTFNCPQSVYTSDHMQSMLCVDSPHVSEEPCAKLQFRYGTIHRTFLDTSCITHIESSQDNHSLFKGGQWVKFG